MIPLHRLLCLLALTTLTAAAQVVEPFRALRPPDAKKTAQELQDDSGKLRAELDKLWPRLPDDPAQPAYLNWPLARLKCRKADLVLQKDATGYYLGYAERFLTEARELLDLKQPYHQGRSGLLELAYVARNDGTSQPYYMHVPEDYDPAKRYPLIVFLHGWVPSINICDPWLLAEPELSLAAEKGYLVAIPYGRRNTDFQGVGEVDVLDVTAEVQKHFSIDRDRIFLSGVSMGGMGTWTIGLRHPQRWAALCPLSGQTDMFIWWSEALDKPGWKRENAPPFKRLLVEWDNAVDIAPNGFAIPIFLQHGELDHLISIDQSRLMVRTADNWGYEVKFHEFTGESHYIYWDVPCYRNLYEFCQHKARNAWPKHIKYRTYSLRYQRCYWASIDEIAQWGKAAYIEARVRDGKVEVTTENVGAFTLELGEELVGDTDQVTLVVNGEQRPPVAKDQRVSVRVLGEPIEGLKKTPTLCGPCEDALNYPFLCVKGTTGPADDQARVAGMFDRWVKEWDEFADGFPRQKDDTAVTDDDIERYNLVLFGEPGTNAVLKRIADKLPINIRSAREYELLGETYAGPDLGLVMIYPNPLNPERYVLIYAGHLYGERCGINHKHDLLPDYIIFRADRFLDHDDTNEYVAAGWFDRAWQPQTDLRTLGAE